MGCPMAEALGRGGSVSGPWIRNSMQDFAKEKAPLGQEQHNEPNESVSEPISERKARLEACAVAVQESYEALAREIRILSLTANQLPNLHMEAQISHREFDGLGGELPIEAVRARGRSGGDYPIEISCTVSNIKLFALLAPAEVAELAVQKLGVAV